MTELLSIFGLSLIFWSGLALLASALPGTKVAARHGSVEGKRPPRLDPRVYAAPLYGLVGLMVLVVVQIPLFELIGRKPVDGATSFSEAIGFVGLSLLGLLYALKKPKKDSGD